MVEINKIKFHQVQTSLITKLSPANETIELKKKPGKKRLPLAFKILIPVFAVILFLAIAGGIAALLVVKPLITQGQQTYAQAQEIYVAIKQQDLVAASDKITKTRDSLASTKKIYDRMSFVRFIPFAGNYWSDGERVIIAGNESLQAAQKLIEAVNPYADILGFKGQGSFAGGTAEDRIIKMVQTLSKITPKLDEIGRHIAEADKQLAQIDPNRYPEKIRGKEIRSKISQAKEVVHEGALALTDAKPVLEVLPTLLGYPDMKRYLTLFQNDGELRPTGGFMTAYGVLRMESGRVRAEKSDDIYALDKKFNSRIKPPEPIAKYLLSADLKTGIVPYYYLRDMNFSPDFRVAMEKDFLPNYQKIKDEPKVDGVIAMDTKVLTNLIAVTGPIDVPGYGKFSNDPDKRCMDIPQIICEMERLVDEPIPGEKLARKDILGPMMQEIILKAMGLPKGAWPNLFQTIINDISQKHIIFYFSDAKAEQAAELFGAAGRIKEYNSDYLHINDANLGGAKSNMFVKQAVEKEITLENGKLVTNLTITYTNPAQGSNCNLERKSGLCLNGILRDYIRVYVPKGSTLIEGLGSEEKFTTSEDLGKTVFAGFFTLRPDGGRAKLVLRYQLPESITGSPDYTLLIQKQPGTVANTYTVKYGGKEEKFDLTVDKELKISAK